MPRRMSGQEWREFEATVASFCELRSEYRRRKEEGTLGRELEAHMIQALNGLDVQIERMRSGDELARMRGRRPVKHVTERKSWRIAQ